jgi:hypothetical protein
VEQTVSATTPHARPVFEEVVDAVLHDLRNSVASIQACTRTQLARRTAETKDLAVALDEVVLEQCTHVLRALHLLEAAREPSQPTETDELESAQIVEAACRATGLAFDASSAPSGHFFGEAARVQIGIEAMIAAMGDSASLVVVSLPEADRCVINATTDADVVGRWEWTAAAGILDEQGCNISFDLTATGIGAEVHFPPGAQPRA